MPKMVDLTGKRFGRLTVIRQGPRKNGLLYWECKCDCGNIRYHRNCELKSGQIISCGCYRKEYMRKKSTKHGLYNEKLRGVWAQMRQRCNNPNHKDYSNYGGRGISVCPEWDEYTAFRNWAISAGYKEGLTIDRINVDGNYTPENCRWIPLSEQMKNRRTSRWYRKINQREPKLFQM